MSDNLKQTPLYQIHVEAQAKIIEFSGYAMPVQYPLGVKQEHLWTREHAGLFDVSHMGQAWLIGQSSEAVARALEKILPADLLGLEEGSQQYTQLLNAEGGIKDDLIVTKPLSEDYNDRMYMVVNAACKEEDYPFIAQQLGSDVRIERLEDRALLALQGPEAAKALESLIPAAAKLSYFNFRVFDWEGHEVLVSRSGYTGEDGFEISLPASAGAEFARKLLAMDEVQLIGLGARDSLRLEAGMCLYGHDLDEETTPVEASLLWSIGKRRREEGGFPGFAKIKDQISNGVTRKRVGLDIDSKAPCREGTEVYAGDELVGRICSGSFSPCLDRPIAMAYIAKEHSKVGTELSLLLRGKRIPAKVCKMPFVQNKYIK